MDVGSESRLGRSPPLTSPAEWIKISSGSASGWMWLLAFASVTNRLPLLINTLFLSVKTFHQAVGQSHYWEHIQGWCSTAVPPSWPYQFLKYLKTFLLVGTVTALSPPIAPHHPTTCPRSSAVCRFMMSGTAGELPGSAHSHWLIPVSYLLLNIVSITPECICWLKSWNLRQWPYFHFTVSYSHQPTAYQ